MGLSDRTRAAQRRASVAPARGCRRQVMVGWSITTYAPSPDNSCTNVEQRTVRRVKMQRERADHEEDLERDGNVDAPDRRPHQNPHARHWPSPLEPHWSPFCGSCRDRHHRFTSCEDLVSRLRQGDEGVLLKCAVQAEEKSPNEGERYSGQDDLGKSFSPPGLCYPRRQPLPGGRMNGGHRQRSNRKLVASPRVHLLYVLHCAVLLRCVVSPGPHQRAR